MNKKISLSKLTIIIIGLVFINYLSGLFFFRLDLTNDKRYTLSNPALEILDEVTTPIDIKVFLTGDFPSDFKRLEIETLQILEEIKSENGNIRFEFIDPLEENTEQLIKMGLEPSQLSIQQNGKTSEVIIFPWSIVANENKFEIVSLLKETNAQSQDEQLESAVENLEYAFINAIHKINSSKSKKIAIIKGNEELDDLRIYDFLSTIGNYYHLAQFTLDSVEKTPQKTLNQLTNYDLAIIAKPQQKFTEKEKYVLDQYFVNGGKTLWMVDQVHAELDSLLRNGETVAIGRDLNITDLLFNYGVRVNIDLVTDLFAAKIPLATGKVGNRTQYNEFLWKYYPLSFSKNNHPVNKNIDPVRFQFTNSIDLLENDIQKTVLLSSSQLSKTIGVPTSINLKSVSEKVDPKQFTDGNKPLAVLLEGNFKSAYKDRIKPIAISNHTDNSEENKMIVISDGDIAANGITKGQPDALGVNKWTGEIYGNKEFLLNTINYLLDDSGLIDIRSKTVDLKVLDKELAFKERSFYQAFNLIIPLIIILLFGLAFYLMQKRKYK